MRHPSSSAQGVVQDTRLRQICILGIPSEIKPTASAGANLSSKKKETGWAGKRNMSVTGLPKTAALDTLMIINAFKTAALDTLMPPKLPMSHICCKSGASRGTSSKTSSHRQMKRVIYVLFGQEPCSVKSRSWTRTEKRKKPCWAASARNAGTSLPQTSALDLYPPGKNAEISCGNACSPLHVPSMQQQACQRNRQ